MPQMAPINWLMLFTFFLFIFFLIMNFLYFNFQKKINLKNFKKTTIKNYNKFI